MDVPPPAPTEKLLESEPTRQRRVASEVIPPPSGEPVARGGAIKAGWVLLLIGLVLACIPVLGFVSWLIGYPLCFAAFILGCLGAANGRAGAGVVLILASITAAPLAIFVAPILTTFIASSLSGPPAGAAEPANLPGDWKPRDYQPAVEKLKGELEGETAPR
jgi:hypothetical protein